MTATAVTSVPPAGALTSQEETGSVDAKAWEVRGERYFNTRVRSRHSGAYWIGYNDALASVRRNLGPQSLESRVDRAANADSEVVRAPRTAAPGGRVVNAAKDVIVRYDPDVGPGVKWAVSHDADAGAHVVIVTDAAPGDLAALLRLLCSGRQR